MVTAIMILRDWYDVMLRFKERSKIKRSDTLITTVQTNSIIDKTNTTSYLDVLVNILKDMEQQDNKMKVTHSNILRFNQFKKHLFELKDPNITQYQLTEEFAKRYLKRMLKSYWSIKKMGYQPERFGYITGWMKGNKFKLWTGHRRTAALMFMDYNEFELKLLV